MDLVKNKQIYFILILKLDRKTFYFEIDCFFEKRRLTWYNMCFGVECVLRIGDVLSRLVGDEMNDLERHVHGQLRRVASIKGDNTFR